MLTVRSAFVPRNIPHKVVAEVAKSAQEQVLLGTGKPPKEMPLGERIVDTVLCGGVKKTAKSQIRGLSHHTASLHLELEKPQNQQIPEKINTHAEEIYLKQKRLSELMSGDTLEFGHIGERAVVGTDSYLIHRSRSKICPTGIPLYTPQERDQSAIPTFRSIDDINAEHLRALRNSETRRGEAMIRCEEVIYRIRFTIIDTPTIVFHKFDEKYLRLQRRLLDLWRENGRSFSLNSPVQPITAALPVPPDPGTGIGATTEEFVPAAGTVTRQSDVSIRDTQTLIIPKFETDQQIKVPHFEQIQNVEQLICAGKLYHVRFDPQNEPIVLCDDLNSATKGVQLVLFKIWITGQARKALNRLQAVNMNPTLEFPFPKTETEQFRIRARLGLDRNWDARAGVAKINFKRIVSLLQKKITADKTELQNTFDSVIENRVDLDKQRRTFLMAESRISELEEREKRSKRNIEDLKEIYLQLFQLARDCTNDEMQNIIFGRIEQFTTYLNKFAETRVNLRTVQELNSIMQNQLRFVKQFTVVQSLLSGHSELILDDRSTAQLPKSRKLKKLNGLRDKLKNLSSEQTTPWENIQTAMHLVQREVRRLSKALILKLNYGLELREMMRTFRGENGEGLNPETQESYYTPSTYARLVSVKEIRDEFLNRRRYMPEDEIKRKIAECKEHLIHIQKETTEISLYEQTEHFEQYRMYIPEQNVTGNAHMNYSQWCDDQKSRFLA